MAAVASVTFTSAGTATLGAAAFTFTVQQAAAEETVASSTEETAIEFSDEDELLASLNGALGEKENEDEDAEGEEAGEEESELEPESAIEVEFNGLYGNSDSFDCQVGSATAADSAPVQAASVQAAPAATSTGTLPSNNLGFTTDVNGDTAASLAKAAVASPAPALMGAAPAADNEQTSLDLKDTAETASTVQTDTLPTAQPAYNGYYGGIYTGPSIRPMAKSAASTPLLGAAEEEPAPADEGSAGYANVITTTFENADQSTAGRVTLQNTFDSAAGGAVPVGAITSLKNAEGADLGVVITGTAGRDATFLSPNANLYYSPWTMVMTFSGAEVVQSLEGITLTVGLFDSNGNWLPKTTGLDGDVTFTATLAAADGGTEGKSLTFTGSLFNGEEGKHYGAGADKFTVNLTGEALDMRVVPNATITLTLTSTLEQSCYVGLQEIKYNVTTVPYTEHDLFWSGGAGSWDKTTENWNTVTEGGSYKTVAFKDGDNIYFYQPGVSSLNITVDRLEAGNVFVDHGAHVQLSAVAGALLTAKNVDVLGDITVTDVAINARDLNIEAGSTVTAITTGEREGVLTPDLHGDGTVVKKGTGTLLLAGDNTEFEGKFIVREGKLVVPTHEAKPGALGLGVNPDVTLAGKGTELAGTIQATGRDIRITSTHDALVSADISALTENATLTFDTRTGSTLTASGTLAGNIYKDGEGTLVITGDNSNANGTLFIYNGTVVATDAIKSLGHGTVHVDSASTLDLTDTSAGYNIEGLDVSAGGTIRFAYASSDRNDGKLLTVDNVFVHSSSFADFSHIKVTAPEFGSNKYYLVRCNPENVEWSDVYSVSRDSLSAGLVQFIGLSGLTIEGSQGDNIASLRVEYNENKSEAYLYLQVDGPQPGYYWTNAAEDNVWDIGRTANWSSSNQYNDDVVFRNSQPLNTQGKTPDVKSAYFLQATGRNTETVELNDSSYELQNLIVGNGKDKSNYEFVSTYEYTDDWGDTYVGSSIGFNSQRPANIIVNSNASLSLDKVTLATLGNNSVIHVCEDAELTSTNASFGAYSVINEGVIDIRASELSWSEDMVGHIVNTGEFNAVWLDYETSQVRIGDIANGGSMTLGASNLLADGQYGSHTIINDGSLTVDASCPLGSFWDMPSGGMKVYIPVTGFGDLTTYGGKTDNEVRFTKTVYDNILIAASTGTVSQNSLTIGAAKNVFEEAVEISGTTTVLSGSEATFYGGTAIDDGTESGSLGAVTLKAGKAGDETKMTLGGYYHYEALYSDDWEPVIISDTEELHDSTYAAGPVTAGEHTVFTVENGAHATIESYNAGVSSPSGTIVVGEATSQETKKTPLTYSDATLVVDGETNVAELTVHKGTETPDKVSVDLRGAANVGHLTQDGGTVHFHADSFLDEGDVSGGVMCIKPGHVLTLGHVITETGDYTVRNNDGFGIPGYIDASNLELVTDTSFTTYQEVKYEGETTRFQSGFIASGRQYVKVFDVQNGSWLTGNDTTIYHKDAAGSMTLISGNDPTVTDLGPYEPKEEGGGGFAGYGYLDIKEAAYTTYYVRDNYVSGNQDGRTDTHDTKVDPRPADQVKLSEIIKGSIVVGKEEPLLQSVVFDQTEYNENVGEANFNGTLTVDVSTKADLFSVTDGTLAALNINDPVNPETEVVVLADQDYQGVQGTLKIAGTDVYQIDNRGDLGQGVSLLKDDTDGVDHWTGTVRLTGTAEDVYMPDLSVNAGEAASTIEFNQWTGTFQKGAQTSDGKIVLVGNDMFVDQSAAITFAETAHNTTTDLTWTNTVTGNNAAVNHREDGNLNLKMTGDTSGWSGHFLQDSVDTHVNLTFDLAPQTEADARKQNTEIWNSAGSMTVTYGGDLETVGALAVVYGDDADLTLAYTADVLAVTGAIAQRSGGLHLVVGDGEHKSVTTFSGVFSETEGADMTVEAGSTAIIDTNAPLLWVRGEEGSTVQVNSGKTLTLTSTNPETYSQFYDLNNQGTIKMEGNGGDIKLVDAEGGKTYNLGVLQIVNGPGTAAIETSSVDGKATTVNITNLSSPATDQTLKLMNDNGQGTVAYNLGGDTNFAGGTIQFGSNKDSGSANVVLQSNDVAANAVLQSTGTSTDKADVVVATDEAQVLGIDSTTDSTVDGTLYGTDGSQKVMTVTGDGTYSYNGALGKNLDIAYTGDGKQTFEGGADNFNGDVTVKSGSTESGILALQNASEVQITDLLIGANDTLEVKNGETNGVAYVSGTLTAEGGPTTERSGSASKLNGDLTLGDSATYDVHAAGGTGGLDLGGALTISTGATLSAGDIALIYKMEIGEKYDLAFDVTKFNNTTTPSGFNEDGTTFGNPIDASELFGGDQFWKGEYYVCFSGYGNEGGNGSNVGTVYLYKATPEPTTGTLSLLALAALAARRRRKG